MKWIGVAVSLILVMALLNASQALASADDLAKQADKIIRNAEKKMFSGKNQEADVLLDEAAALIEQGKMEDAANAKILRTEKKFVRIRKNVDNKLGKLSPEVKPLPSSASSTAIATKPSSGAKLPGGVKKRLRDISGHLKNVQRYADSDAKKAKSKLDQARRLFADIEKQYAGQFDPAHPDFAAVKNQYDELTVKVADQEIAEAEATVAAAEAKATDAAARAKARAVAEAEKAQTDAETASMRAAGEKQSEAWIAKFQSYLSYPGQTGHNPDMVVFVPGTSEPEKFADAQKRYEALKSFYETYKQTEFPNGKAWKLEDLADNQTPRRLKDFEEGFASRVASVSGDAEKEIDAAMRQLEKDNGWKSDKTVKPNLIDQNRMTSIRKSTRKVLDALEKSDPKRQAIETKFDALVAKDQANRQIRKERTVMTPDRYAGRDIGQLKKKAESLVKENKKEGGEPLRATIISNGWQEETIKEWTDTSRTAWRIRTTRRVTGQVAARTSSGVRLITVALAQDKQSNGSWGALYGNLHQYSDPMLESNVRK